MDHFKVYEVGDRVPGYNTARVDRWIKLPLKCNYTILYFVAGTFLFDWEPVDIKWWTRDLWW